MIYLKYMKAMISYDNVTRIETYSLPKAAVREAVYNAIIHSNYMEYLIHHKGYAAMCMDTFNAS